MKILILINDIMVWDLYTFVNEWTELYPVIPQNILETELVKRLIEPMNLQGPLVFFRVATQHQCFVVSVSIDSHSKHFTCICFYCRSNLSTVRIL